MPLEAFGRSGLAVYVDSEVVSETVLFVADGYRPAAGDPVAYAADELLALMNEPPDTIRAVHAVKKAFPGAAIEVDARAYPRAHARRLATTPESDIKTRACANR
jgi:hypothetical protein